MTAMCMHSILLQSVKLPTSTFCIENSIGNVNIHQTLDWNQNKKRADW